MFSIKGDTILDPFFGIGTTMYAAMATARNSIGYEIDPSLRQQIISQFSGIVNFSNKRIEERLEKHLAFVDDRVKTKGKFKYTNDHYLFPVMTRQETDLTINELLDVHQAGSDSFEVSYSDNPQKEYVGSWDDYVQSDTEKNNIKKRTVPKKRIKNYEQQQLF